MIENINFNKSNYNIIDVASGTGDLAKYILKNQNKKLARIDPNKNMLNKNAKFLKITQMLVQLNP